MATKVPYVWLGSSGETVLAAEHQVMSHAILTDRAGAGRTPSFSLLVLDLSPDRETSTEAASRSTTRSSPA
jgi:hypothetical protein